MDAGRFQRDFYVGVVADGTRAPQQELRGAGRLYMAVQEWVYRGADLDESLDRALAFIEPLLTEVQEHP